MQLRYSKKAEGVASICGPFGEIANIKTVTCAHCDKIMYVSPFGDGTGEVELPKEAAVSITTLKREPPAVCHQCWSLVCPKCHADGRCTPLLKRLEEMEEKNARGRMWESVGIL